MGDKVDSLDGKHTVFGIVTEGWDTIEKLNNTISDDNGVPYQDIRFNWYNFFCIWSRISHVIILDDPFLISHPFNLNIKSPYQNIDSNTNIEFLKVS